MDKNRTTHATSPTARRQFGIAIYDTDKRDHATSCTNVTQALASLQ